MDVKLIQAIMQFMQRVNLQGSEVPAFTACMVELQKLAQTSGPMLPPHLAGQTNSAGKPAE